MVFLGLFGKDPSKEDLINKDRKEYEKRRKRFLEQYEREKAEANDYFAERRRVKAERRAKVKAAFSKASSGFDGLSSTFDLGGVSSGGNFNEGKGSGLDLFIIDDHKDYPGKRAPAYRDTLGEFFSVSPPRSKGGRDSLADMFSFSAPKGRAKRSKSADPFDLFSMTPQRKGRRNRTDFGGWL